MEKKIISEREFNRRMKDVANDIIGDGRDIEEVAYDVAENLLYDPELRAYAARRVGANKMMMVTYLAESINP